MSPKGTPSGCGDTFFLLPSFLKGFYTYHIFFSELCIKRWKIEEAEIRLSCNFFPQTQKKYRKNKKVTKPPETILKPTPHPPFHHKISFAPMYPWEGEKEENHLGRLFLQTTISPKTRKEVNFLVCQLKDLVETRLLSHQFFKKYFF